GKKFRATYETSPAETDKTNTEFSTGAQRRRPAKKFGPFLDLCVSSLRRGHANLLCIVPILSDVPEGTNFIAALGFLLCCNLFSVFDVGGTGKKFRATYEPSPPAIDKTNTEFCTGVQRRRPAKKFGPFLDLCVSSLRRGHANLLCIVPILSDVPEGTDSIVELGFLVCCRLLSELDVGGTLKTMKYKYQQQRTQCIATSGDPRSSAKLGETGNKTVERNSEYLRTLAGGDRQNKCRFCTGAQRRRPAKKFGPFLDLCVSSLRRGHANLLCIVPILSDVPEGTNSIAALRFL
ncbi:hypothetical protein H5410_053727, partial [Solanum commersonii]